MEDSTIFDFNSIELSIAFSTININKIQNIEKKLYYKIIKSFNVAHLKEKGKKMNWNGS
jgi:hypothetical protein